MCGVIFVVRMDNGFFIKLFFGIKIDVGGLRWVVMFVNYYFGI